MKHGDMARGLSFLFLLRDDVRKGAPLDDAESRKDLEAWCVLHGIRDYPAFAAALQRDDLPHLADVVSPALPGEAFGITRLMRALWRERADVGALHPLETPHGAPGFIRWFFAHGVPEHRLFRFLPDGQARLLLQPDMPPETPWDTACPLLARYTWHAKEDLQAEHCLTSPLGRSRYLGWYFCEGARRCGHLPYWAVQPPVWLALPHPACPGLSRLAVLAWLWRNPSRAPEALAEPGLRAHVARWFEHEASPRYALDELFSPPQDAPRTRPRAPARRAVGPGANIVGFARGELGIGEDSRMAAAALHAAGAPFAVVNVSPGPDVRQQDSTLDGRLTQDAPYPANLFCLTGMDTARVWLERGPELFAGRVNIGCWPWELPRWPEAWRDAYRMVDEIWVSSRYTRQAFEHSSPVPVRLMPMAVRVDDARLLPRAAYGLPDNAFLFLYVFDFNSYMARKNPWAALRAFRRAFPGGREPVRLALKVMNARPRDERWTRFAREAAQDPRVLFFNGTMDRRDLLGLFNACDAYVSPHRSEGFGRTLAEAMLLGKPVVATGYSGSADFLTEETGYPVGGRLIPLQEGDYPFGEGLFWADPDIDHFSRCMRDVFTDPAEARRRAENGRSLIAARHNPLVVGRAYKDRLEHLLRGFQRP